MKYKKLVTLFLFVSFFISGYTLAGDFELIVNVDSVKCNGDSSGQININVEYFEATSFSYILYDKPPFQGGEIIFNSGLINSNEYTINNLPAGKYIVLIEAMDGKVSLKNISIFEPDPFVIEGIVECNQSQVNKNLCIEIIANGGMPPYSYLWTMNTKTFNMQSIECNEEGTYIATVKDTNGCMSKSMSYYYYSNFLKKITYKIFKN